MIKTQRKPVAAAGAADEAHLQSSDTNTNP